jgi:hypothetical protein
VSVIAINDRNVVFATGFNKLFQVWDYMLGSFTLQISGNKIVEHIDYQNSFVVQKSPSSFTQS